MTTETPQQQGLPTRLAHGALALAVVTQLATSLVMTAPRPGRPENIWFEVHEISGLAALAAAFIFWLAVTYRQRGAAPGALFPWFSGARRAALATDVRHWGQSLRQFTLRSVVEAAPLATCIHGLGLLLMSAMAVTGTVWLLAETFEAAGAGWPELVIEVHKTMASLVWAYLIGHATLALLHHWRGALPLTTMWSLRASPAVSEDRRGSA